MTSDLQNAQLTPVREQLRLNVRHWPGEGRPFVLLHGLASNSLTWAVVARHLQAAGHAVYAVDQRGHGHSDKPDDGYDFGTVTEDLELLCDRLGLASPIVAGQSWGGNVVLEFGARYPTRAARAGPGRRRLSGSAGPSRRDVGEDRGPAAPAAAGGHAAQRHAAAAGDVSSGLDG